MKSKYRIDQGQISCDIASEPIAMAESRISENPARDSLQQTIAADTLDRLLLGCSILSSSP